MTQQHRSSEPPHGHMKVVLLLPRRLVGVSNHKSGAHGNAGLMSDINWDLMKSALVHSRGKFK